MNGPLSNVTPPTTSAIPVESQALCPAPQLLPGESIDHYRALQTVIFRDIAPQSAIEWLLAIDVAELSWDMQRCRVLRHRLLNTYRQQAIEMALRRIDMVPIAPHLHYMAEFYTLQNAHDWKHDPIAAIDIESRLASYGFDQHTISMEVYLQATEVISIFESLLNGAQLRRLLLLKELNNFRRSSGRSVIFRNEDTRKSRTID